VSKKRAVELLQ